jgi:hypothetical protein
MNDDLAHDVIRRADIVRRALAAYQVDVTSVLLPLSVVEVKALRVKLDMLLRPIEIGDRGTIMGLNFIVDRHT